MSHIYNVPLQFNFPCKRCGETNVAIRGAQEVVAESALGLLHKGLEELFSRHWDISSGSGRGRKEVDQLRRELVQAQGERDRFHQERDELEEQNAGINRRLAEKLADQTTRRMDVGTTMHTAHRELSHKVSGLYSKVQGTAREWLREMRAGQHDPRTLAFRAAILFRLLFAPDISAPHLITEHDREMWEVFRGVNGKAQALAVEATSLAEQIKELEGYQQWIWDIAPRGTMFNSSLHVAWQGCLDEGGVDFVVIPAYLVDLSVIAKPQVFTRWV